MNSCELCNSPVTVPKTLKLESYDKRTGNIQQQTLIVCKGCYEKRRRTPVKHKKACK